MARPPDGSAPRSKNVVVRLTPQGLAALDQARGAQTRSSYIRALLAADAKRRHRKEPHG